MQVGFTGTRHGCTPAQLAALRTLLLSIHITEFHHGKCVGADAQAHLIMQGQGAKIIIHPSNLLHRQAVECIGNLEMPPKPPLDRNKVIVRSTKRLIATPSGFEEELRSGTWMTIRYARACKQKITIVWPNGEITGDQSRYGDSA